jgi:chromate reductase, NAD(P)H dehydrogenase (quinone)
MNQPELLVFRAHERFGAAGNLVAENVTRFLDAYLAAFLTWSRRLRSASFEPAPMQRAG